MELTLLLNATYEPLRVLNWQKAVTLLWQGKVEVLEVYDREIHGVSISFKLPSASGSGMVAKRPKRPGRSRTRRAP